MPPSAAELWQMLLWGYLLTITLETPVLLFGFSERHSWQRRLFAGAWLTACTYPIVGIFLPLTVWPQFGYVAYLIVAEIFAPVAECAVFLWAFGGETASLKDHVRDCAAIVVANLVSFILGGYLYAQMQ
jgi:hypothetical protein